MLSKSIFVSVLTLTVFSFPFINKKIVENSPIFSTVPVPIKDFNFDKKQTVIKPDVKLKAFKLKKDVVLLLDKSYRTLKYTSQLDDFCWLAGKMLF